MLAGFACGCGFLVGEGKGGGKPAYADLDRLVSEQRGWGEVRKLEAQIARLRSRLPLAAGVKPEALIPTLPPLSSFSAAEGPEPDRTRVQQQTRELTEGQLELIRVELTRAVEEKLAASEQELRRQVNAELVEERRRQEELLWQRRQQVLEEYSRRLLSLRGKVELLVPGDPRREQEAKRLAALEAEQERRLASLRAETEAAITAFSRAREADIKMKLDALRAQLLQQKEERLARARALTERRASEAEKTLTTALEPKPPPEVRLDLSALSSEMTARARKLEGEQRSQAASRVEEIERLERLRDRLKRALRGETAETAAALAARHGYRVVFERKKGKTPLDITDRLSGWLASWSRQPGGARGGV